MKIAAFLGSFDPPHLAHYLIAEKALKDGMDRVYFIPAKQNPWKKSQPASFDHRVKMLEFYTLDEPRFLVSRIEEEVESFYSYDVLRAFKEKFQEENEFYLLCGTDVARSIGSWYRGEDILKEWKILDSFRPTIKDEETDTGICLSSTEIRESIKNNIRPLPWILPDQYDYIIENALYRD